MKTVKHYRYPTSSSGPNPGEFRSLHAIDTDKAMALIPIDTLIDRAQLQVYTPEGWRFITDVPTEHGEIIKTAIA